MLPQRALAPSPDEVAGALMIPASGWSRYRIGTYARDAHCLLAGGRPLLFGGMAWPRWYGVIVSR
jgi:hypothetical protein